MCACVASGARQGGAGLAVGAVYGRASRKKKKKKKGGWGVGSDQEMTGGESKLSSGICLTFP